MSLPWHSGRGQINVTFLRPALERLAFRILEIPSIGAVFMSKVLKIENPAGRDRRQGDPQGGQPDDPSRARSTP